MDYILSWVPLLLAWASLFFALGAAIFWARSAFVRIPNLPDTDHSGPMFVAGLMRIQSRLNANAAGCAAATAVMQIILKMVAA